jgi:four helix bundle protein
MFDFENLVVYKKAKSYNKSITKLLLTHQLDRSTKDQLRRASLSIMLNIAEGTGRATPPDKRRFYIMARGSTFECVSIFDYLHDVQIVNKAQYDHFYSVLEEISKMLYAMIRTMSKR